MGTEKSALKRSFFREYFFYKLRGTLGIAITSAVLGFITCTLSGIFALMTLKILENEIKDNSGIYSIPDVGALITIALLGLVGMTVLALIAPIVSFKYYRSRSSMDTLGCLPITYRERFWGDYLSGLAAIVAPFSVMAAIGGILLAAIQPIVDSAKEIGVFFSKLDGANNGTLLFGVKMYLVMLIIIVAAYSITTLVVSCCGKAGSSALYSVIALPIIPAVVALYGKFTLNNTKGILPNQYINTLLSCFPPVGMFIYLEESGINIYSDEGNFMLIPNAATVIVSLLFIAAMIAAAYFNGKRRKTERVGNSFVVNAMYHILTLLMVLAVIGVYFSTNRILGIDLTKVIIGAVIALVFYLILELIQYRNFKTIWKSLIRYACVAVVGFGFLIIGIKTEGFGIGKCLPNQNNIEEITIDSRDFGNGIGTVGTVKYRAENAISVILDMNKLLVDNSDKIYTGEPYVQDDGINITYKLKNGDTVARYYRINDDSLRSDIVEKIKKQPTYEVELLGVLNRDDLTGIKLTFTPVDDNGNPQNENAVQIKDSKIPELVERLKYDIINGERNNDRSEYIGALAATLPKGDEDESMSYYYYYTHWFIDKTCTRTIEFLNNPDNFTEKKPEDPNAPADKVKLYRVSYQFFRTDESEPSPAVTSATVKFRSDSDSKYAKELMSYFVSGSIQVDDAYFYISTLDAETEWYVDDESFYIPKENQDAALKAMMNLIAEQVAEM